MACDISVREDAAAAGSESLVSSEEEDEKEEIFYSIQDIEELEDN